MIPWISGLTIGEMLRRTAQKYPQQEACVYPLAQVRWNFAELDRRVDQLARALLAIGIEKGDRVAVWCTNWPEWQLLMHACSRIGAILVTVNPAYRAHELEYVLRQSGARALFLIDQFRGSSYLEMLRQISSKHPTAYPWPPPPVSPRTKSGGLDFVIGIRCPNQSEVPTFESLLALADSVSGEQLAAREASLAPDEPINIQYTSGTTGFPKGATLSHANLLNNAFYVGDCQGLSEHDRLCLPVPFYHCFGCVMGILTTAVFGSCLVIPSDYFQPEPTLATIESERATSLYGVPTMFIGQLDHPTRPSRNLTSLRTGIMAGSPCPIEVMKRVVSELHVPEITIAYGLTEASPVITQTRVDDPLETRVKTVGRPIPGVEVKVIDPVTKASLGDNEQGELCCRGHGVMLGYYNNHDATQACIDPEGWLHSGDLALRQPDGYYRITGRIKDMVCRGGENIYPREIEEFLYAHPSIQDVAVVGVPDLKYVEELAVWVRLKPDCTLTEAELRQFCQGKLAHYKIPRHIRFVTAFPTTVTGKIQKFKIREEMIRDLGLEQAAKRETA